jgi:hypothetical protein
MAASGLRHTIRILNKKFDASLLCPSSCLVDDRKKRADAAAAAPVNLFVPLDVKHVSPDRKKPRARSHSHRGRRSVPRAVSPPVPELAMSMSTQEPTCPIPAHGILPFLISSNDCAAANPVVRSHSPRQPSPIRQPIRHIVPSHTSLPIAAIYEHQHYMPRPVPLAIQVHSAVFSTTKHWHSQSL